jgi:acyl carrier protein
MNKEQIRASIPRIVAQVVSDEDLSNLKGDIPIPEQVGPDSMDFPGIVMELRKPYFVVAPSDDHMQLATLSDSIAYQVPHEVTLG